MASSTVPKQKNYRSSGGETVRRAKKQRFNPLQRDGDSKTGAKKSKVSDGKRRDEVVASDSDEVHEERDAEDDDDTVQDLETETRKTSGTGKKPKKFVESQSDLLSLVHSITGAQEAKKKDKLRKIKKPAAPSVEKRIVDAKAQKKQAELEAAKTIIAARTKAKKEKIKVGEGKGVREESEGRKRVSFA